MLNVFAFTFQTVSLMQLHPWIMFVNYSTSDEVLKGLRRGLCKNQYPEDVKAERLKKLYNHVSIEYVLFSNTKILMHCHSLSSVDNSRNNYIVTIVAIIIFWP